MSTVGVCLRMSTELYSFYAGVALQVTAERLRQGRCRQATTQEVMVQFLSSDDTMAWLATQPVIKRPARMPGTVPVTIRVLDHVLNRFRVVGRVSRVSAQDLMRFRLEAVRNKK